MKGNAFARLMGMGVLAIGASVVQASLVNSAAAAAAVCGPKMVTGSYLPRAAPQRCVVEAINSTIVHLHNDLLSAYYQQETRDQKEAHRPGA